MKKYYLLLVFILLFGNLYSQNQVVFFVQYDSENHKNVSHSSYDYISNRFYLLESKVEILNNKTEKITIVLSKEAEINIFKHSFFVEPGQKYYVKYYLEKDSISVKSKYNGNYLYNGLLNNRKYEILDFDQISNNELILAQKLKNNCLIKLGLIDSLYSKNVMTKKCKKYIHNEIYFSYLSSLIYLSGKINHNDSSLKKSILKEVKISEFQDSSNLSSKFYGFALADLCFYVLNNQNSIIYNTENLKNLIHIINTNFSGQQKEYLLSYVFRLYCRKQIQEYDIFLKSLYLDLNLNIKSNVFKEVITSWYEYYMKANKEMPDYVMNAFVYDTKGDSVMLKALLINEKKNVLDFWASWCSPCISQIKEYSDKKIMADRQLNFIFISIDEDSTNFNSIAKKLNLNSYRLSNFSSNKVQTYFSIPPIPFSVLLEANKVKDLKFDVNAFLKML